MCFFGLGSFDCCVFVAGSCGLLGAVFVGELMFSDFLNLILTWW